MPCWEVTLRTTLSVALVVYGSVSSLRSPALKHRGPCAGTVLLGSVGARVTQQAASSAWMGYVVRKRCRDSGKGPSRKGQNAFKAQLFFVF